jgi:trehalose 6-phosphate synthase/phosphatase
VQGVSKGLVVDKVIHRLMNNGKTLDFVVCIGNDRSDEDMFKSIDSMTSSSAFPAVPEVFACSVGQKPSKAKYYVDNAGEVVRLLKNIAGISLHREAVNHGRVIFRDVIDYVD